MYTNLKDHICLLNESIDNHTYEAYKFLFRLMTFYEDLGVGPGVVGSSVAGVCSVGRVASMAVAVVVDGAVDRF